MELSPSLHRVNSYSMCMCVCAHTHTHTLVRQSADYWPLAWSQGSVNSGWKVMKYLLNKKAACLFVGEAQCDTCPVKDKTDTAEDSLLDRTLANGLQICSLCSMLLELKYLLHVSKYLNSQNILPFQQQNTLHNWWNILHHITCEI